MKRRPLLVLAMFLFAWAGLGAAPAATAGELPAFALGNRVWFDTDNSGTINGGEVGIDGVSVNLYNANNLNVSIGTSTTINGGYYLFTGLPAGDYVVAIAASNFSGVLKGYWSSGTSRTNAGTITETTAPLANTDIDSDDNGTLQTSGPLAGAVTSSVVTLGPAANAEPVGETDLNNGNQGGPDAQSNMTVDFGFYKIRVGNLVWNDLDNSGTLGAGEPGLDGVTVELWSADGSTLLGSTTTAGGGNYFLDGQPAGSYIVRLPAVNFNPGGVLRDFRSSTGPIPALAYEPAPDPNSNKTDADDNGTETGGLLGLGGYIQSLPVTLAAGGPLPVDNATGTTSEARVDFGVNHLPQIDLSVTITDNTPTYAPAGTLNYVVVITNNGPADANGMTITGARAPQIASWSWACAPGTPAGYNCTSDNTNPATFTDTLDLPQLASVTYNVTAQVAPDATGALTSGVFVTPPPGMTDLTPADNIAADVDQRLAQLDIAVTKTDNQTTYEPGGTLSYVVTVTNNGPGSALGVTLSDARPAQIASWTWACAAGTPAGYNCTGDNTNPATFTDTLDLPHLASVTYNVTAQIAQLVSGSLTNTVTVAPPGGFTDPNPANNSATDVDALALTTIAVTKSATPNPVFVGDTLTWTVQVTNTGAVNATGLSVSDTLPAGVAYLGASGTGWSCGNAASVVTCTRPLLAPGAAPPIVILAATSNASPSSLVNSVTASAVNALASANASVQTDVRVRVIPTLDRWALLLLVLLVGGAAGWRRRRA